MNWPNFIERTPPDERENTSKFSVGYRKTKKQLREEFERMGVDKWRLEDVTGSGADPGIVVRWTVDGVDHVVACDAYTHKKQNIREIYQWINETRMRSQRPVETGQDEFAAARLPPGSADDTAVAVAGAVPAHDILDVKPGAPEEVVKGAFREKVKKVHGDTGGRSDNGEVQRLKRARDEMLGK